MLSSKPILVFFLIGRLRQVFTVRQYFCLQAAKALAKQHTCAGLSEPTLLAYATITQILEIIITISILIDQLSVDKMENILEKLL